MAADEKVSALPKGPNRPALNNLLRRHLRRLQPVVLWYSSSMSTPPSPKKKTKVLARPVVVMAKVFAIISGFLFWLALIIPYETDNPTSPTPSTRPMS